MSTKCRSKMDKRCPRQLEDMPETWCPLAVLRLKHIRNAGRELTEEEESKLPGCPWAVDHQMSNYCFFKYLSEFAEDKTPSDIELAALLNVSVETVKKIEKTALAKLREHQSFRDLKGSEPIVQDKDEEFTIYR